MALPSLKSWNQRPGAVGLDCRKIMSKPSVAVMSQLGIGDCLHERAVLRELMKTNDVTLCGWYPSLVHDLVDQGLKFHQLLSPGMARIKDIKVASSARPTAGQHMRLTYNADAIHRAGSILAAQFACCGLMMPDRPDFSLPVRQEWREKANVLIAEWKPDRPLLIYRPIVLNKFWECRSRSPDPGAYAAIFAEIRDKFFVVSITDLTQSQEWIVGPEQDADIKLHRGEADFETLAGLFAESALVFCNPGFSPVLAQAVGTPSIIVYGGNESFRTTNSVGAHLSPTLAIEPLNPCECHARTHDCDKRIDVVSAVEKVREFACRFAS